MTWLCVLAMLAAAIPAVLVARNLRVYRPPPAPRAPVKVSILVPARDEVATIATSVEAALASRGADVEVLVYDDASTDGTPSVVRALAERDARVKLLRGSGPPAGWCGKTFACAQLAEAAAHPFLLFVDADVHLEPDGAARAAAFLEETAVDLASGFPRQVTKTISEKLAIPLLHFALLGFLPIRRSRMSSRPSLAAGCGQLFVARAESYGRAGGHGAIRASLHDGLDLPRAFRGAGLKTDLFDATPVASCRMYRGFAELFRGLERNARAGVARNGAILTLSVGFLVLGQVLPFVLAPAVWLSSESSAARGLAVAVLGLAWAPRWLLAIRFRQSLLGALLHPAGASLLVAIQLAAALGSLRARETEWRGRRYASGASA